MVGQERFESVKIAGFTTLAAITYGIIHDEITAHLCVEYFTIAHPPILPTQSPFLLGLGWGIIATWWVGLPLGLGLAIAARYGPMPKVSLRQLRYQIGLLVLTTAAAALAAGSVAAFLRSSGTIATPPGWEALVPANKQVAFTADAWSHGASYLSGVFTGLLLIVRTWKRRISLRRASQTAF